MVSEYPSGTSVIVIGITAQALQALKHLNMQSCTHMHPCSSAPGPILCLLCPAGGCTHPAAAVVGAAASAQGPAKTAAAGQ